MESQFDIRRYISILRRRWLYLVIPAILVAIASVGFAYTTPPVYEASATILVESQQIPTDLASPTVTSDAAERIRVIEQRLMTRDNLLQIAGKYSLYQYLGPNLSPTTMVESVRRAIRIDQIDTFGATQNVVGFTVKFQYRDGPTAARVTNELVTSILSQNVESRLSRASETSEFFSQQKTSLEQRLLELEHKMADFKRSNEADLPETLEVRREQLIQIRLQVSDIDQKIRIAQAPDDIGLELAGGQAGIRQLSISLEAKKIELKSLQEQREELVPLAEKGFVPANRMRDLDRQISLAELDIDSINAQIADRGGGLGGEDGVKYLEEQRSKLDAQATELNDSILRTPLIQVQLNSMDRDYENLQSEYRQAQAKLENAQIGERLEQDRQSERFEVIEQATVPDQPSSPDRPKIMLAGIASGFAAGAGLIILRQLLDNAVYSAADIERALHLRPIAVVPYVKTSRENSRSRRRVIIAIVLAILAVLVGLYLVHTYYQPLDILLQRQWDRVHGFLASRGLMG
jgi:uncharacterized protein involved in exopolysaccharide biosynthesis